MDLSLKLVVGRGLATIILSIQHTRQLYLVFSTKEQSFIYLGYQFCPMVLGINICSESKTVS